MNRADPEEPDGPHERGLDLRDALHLGLVCLVALAAMALGWVGHAASDDQMYVGGAVGWLEQFPFVGQNHWELRHTIVMPIAVSIAVLGYTEVAFVAPVMGYTLALLVLTYLGVRATFGRATATLSAVVLALTPLLAVDATRVVADETELFYLALSLWLFSFATRAEGGRRRSWLVASGLALGLACVTRETSGLLVLYYGALFLLGRGVPRARYGALFAGFVLVMGADTFYLWVQTGDPLHRVVTDLGTHLGLDLYESEEVASEFWESAKGPDLGAAGALDKSGNLTYGSLVDPALVMFANQEFGLTYYLALPLGLLLVGRRRLPDAARAWLRLALGFVGAWLVYLWFFRFGMSLAPRYFLPTTYVAAIALAAGIVHVVWPRRVLAAALLGALFATNLLAIWLDNGDPDYGERRLRDYLLETEGIVHTDPRTAKRGTILFRIAGVEDRVSDEPPRAGDVYFRNWKHALWAPRGSDYRAFLERFHPRPGWRVVQEIPPEQPSPVRFLEATGLRDLLPEQLERHLAHPSPVATVYVVEE